MLTLNNQSEKHILFLNWFKCRKRNVNIYEYYKEKSQRTLLVAVHINNHWKSCNSKIPQCPCLHSKISWSWKYLFLHPYFCLHNNNCDEENKSMQCATTFRWRHFLSEFFDRIFVLWWDVFISIYQHLDIVLKYSCDRNYIMF